MIIPLCITGCVSKKVFQASQASLLSARTDSSRLAGKVTELEKNVADLTRSNASLQQDLTDLKTQLDATSKDAAGKIATQQSLLNKSKEEIATQQQKLAALQELLEQLTVMIETSGQDTSVSE